MAAPLGNLNGAKYPWRSYWSRRALKREDSWVLRFVESYPADLISDKGGPEEVTAGEKRMIEVASAARVCWMLAISRNDWKAAGTFMTAETRALSAIGLDRRARDVGGNLDNYLKRLQSGQAGENNGTPQD